MERNEWKGSEARFKRVSSRSGEFEVGEVVFTVSGEVSATRAGRIMNKADGAKAEGEKWFRI